MPLFSKKKKDKSNSSTQETRRNSEMPLFRRQSEKCRKKQQDKELIAQQDPEPRFDLSGCEMTEVPSGVFAICKVLQKQVLLLHDNWLHCLSGGGSLEDLAYLTVLDLHGNEFKHLPDTIGNLARLEVLDVSNNRLKDLPKTFDQLKLIQTLNLRKNRFKSFPNEVTGCRYLRTLDLSDNEIDSLPLKLTEVRALETLVLDVNRIKYPKQDICRDGTASVMQFLCKEADVIYEHPSKFWLSTSGGSKPSGISSSTSDSNITASLTEAENMEGVREYQFILDQKRREAEEIERQMHEEEEAEAELAARAAESQRNFLSSIKQQDVDITKDLEKLNQEREKERQEFLKYLTDVENGSNSLLEEILDYNTKALETEKILQELEDDRMKEEDWFSVRWEELQNVRKNEVLDAMKVMLTESKMMEHARQLVEQDKDEMRAEALEEEVFDDACLESLMTHQDSTRRKMVENLAQEEALQKAAFEALMLSSDAAHQRIMSQIVLIETELAQLTAVEIRQREERAKNELNIIAEQRVALSAMLSQLFEEKDKRKAELKKRLIEMEQQREDGQVDYWLVQYQRLFDMKPQALIDRESQLEIAVKDVLIAADAEEYIPLFARHRITIETLVTLSEDDLKQMGIHELGTRRAILTALNKQRSGVKSAEQKMLETVKDPVLPSSANTPASAPLPDAAATIPTPPTPSSILLERQTSVTARGINSECSICLDRQSSVIFLPCGHVCCCPVCAQPLLECPLCRAEIVSKIKLNIRA